jgi:thiamine biosynthesis protein ThiS
MPLQITFTANRVSHTVTAGQTIGDFLRTRGLNPGLVVIEHNGIVLSSGEPDRILLHNGDRLEIVRNGADT